MRLVDLGGRITHDSVTLTFRCSKCTKIGFLVMEYGSDGKTWWLGKYERAIRSKGKHKLSRRINGLRIIDCFDS